MPVALRLLSWNVHGTPGTRERSQRLDRIAGEVLRRGPDVLLLQEVWLDPDRSRLIDRLAGTYSAIDVRPQGWLGRPGGLLTGIRRQSPWRTADAGFRPYRMAAARWRVWEGDGIGRKGLQRIELTAGGHRVVVFNTHLQASYPWNRHGHVRGRQLLELQSLAQGVDAGAAVFVAGDLNTRPEDPEYRFIRAAWVDLTAELRARDGSGTCLEGDGSDAGWLDYVLARPHPGWQVTTGPAELIVNAGPDVPYSDHHGLELTLQLARTTDR